MKRLFKLVLLFFPFLVLGLILSVNYYLTSRIFSQMQDADGFVMGTADDRYVVHTKSSVANEIVTDVINVTDKNGKLVKSNSISMDHDMFGLGFVRAMQADSDPELELVAWGTNIREGKPFFLDFTDGRITERPLEELSEAAQDLIKAFKTTTLRTYGLTAFTIVLTPVYYIIYIIIFLIKVVIGRRRQTEAGA